MAVTVPTAVEFSATLKLAALEMSGALSLSGVTVMAKLPVLGVPAPSSTLKPKLSEKFSLLSWL